MALDGNIEFIDSNTTYNVARLEQAIQTTFGRWAEKECLAVLKVSKPQYTPDEYLYLLSEHQAMKRRGQFELYIGSESAALLRSNDGFRQLLYLCFAKHHAVTREQVNEIIDRRPDDCGELFAEILGSKKNSTDNSDSTSS